MEESQEKKNTTIDIEYVRRLEDFIAELEPSLVATSRLEELSRYVKRGGKAHRLWTRLRLNKYPGDY